MPTNLHGPGDFLEYNPQYRLLICRQCRYAVQKNALKSHLLRHKIYRSDRQHLLSSISRLDIAEPEQVSLPVQGSPPISSLPILSGFRCRVAECRHLTVSAKRMKRHWTDVHTVDGSAPLPSSFAHPVKLQTFFRGTKNRYFEVASSTVPPLDTDDDGHNDDHEQNHDIATVTANLLPPQSPPSNVLAAVGTSKGFPLANFTLEVLTYFHHFITSTSFTLPVTQDARSSTPYWQTHVIPQALQLRWLMSGLLAISACHMAALANDAAAKQTHREQVLQFSSDFFAGLEQISQTQPSVDAGGTKQEVKEIGERIRCLLWCARWTLAESSLSLEAVAPPSLPDIISTIRGCIASDPAFQYSGPQHGSGERREESFASALPPSHAFAPISSSDNKTPSVLLDRLHALPFRITERIGRPEDVQDAVAVLSAITTLVKCCDISFASDEARTAYDGVVIWLGDVSDHFNHMVMHHHPAALLVLVHWAAILVKRAERVGCWFLKGSPEKIVLQVTRLLSIDGHTVLDLVRDLAPIMSD